MPADPLIIHGLESIAADILSKGAGDAAVNNTKLSTGVMHYLRGRVDDLESLLHTMMARQPVNDESNERIFPVTKDGGNKWSELVMSNGALAAHPGGRTVTSDADICAFVEMTVNQGILIEMRDTLDPAKMRYVLVAGGAAETVGQYMGMGHVMVSDNTAGWDFDRATAAIV